MMPVDEWDDYETVSEDTPDDPDEWRDECDDE